MTSHSAIRLIIDGPASGAWNMAVDEALLRSAQNGVTTIRFYEWTPATLSLGYFQAYEDRKQHAASESCPVVRRTTGGGAILHDRELTYSITLPCRDRFSQSAEQIYDAFHDTLVESLSVMGVRATRCEQADPTQENNFLCFQRRARGDVLLNGYKIAGSAQRRQGGGLLQHGSVLLAASDFATEVPGVKELAKSNVSVCSLVNEWIDRLQVQFELSFARKTLTSLETETAKEVAISRFEQPSWQGRR